MTHLNRFLLHLRHHPSSLSQRRFDIVVPSSFQRMEWRWKDAVIPIFLPADPCVSLRQNPQVPFLSWTSPCFLKHLLNWISSFRPFWRRVLHPRLSAGLSIWQACHVSLERSVLQENAALRRLFLIHVKPAAKFPFEIEGKRDIA